MKLTGFFRNGPYYIEIFTISQSTKSINLSEPYQVHQFVDVSKVYSIYPLVTKYVLLMLVEELPEILQHRCNIPATVLLQITCLWTRSICRYETN